MGFIRLKSSDDQVFFVDVKVAKQSTTLKDMLDDLGCSDDDGEEPILLPNVDGTTLGKVIEWATYHKDDPPYVRDECLEERTDDIPDWDIEFLKVDQTLLFAILMAANYLNIKQLFDLTCKTVAKMIKGKSPEEIHETFDGVFIDADTGKKKSAAATEKMPISAKNFAPMES